PYSMIWIIAIKRKICIDGLQNGIPFCVQYLYGSLLKPTIADPMSVKTKSQETDGHSRKALHDNPELTRPKIGQVAAEIQAFGTIVQLPNVAGETVCKESIDRCQPWRSRGGLCWRAK